MAVALHYRSLFISDLHLGSRWSQFEPLMAFLKRVSGDQMYLVGDVYHHGDGLLESDCRRVFDQIVKLCRAEQLHCLVGNHDSEGALVEDLRCRFEVSRRIVHECADGRRFLVVHGHHLDNPLVGSAFMQSLGNCAYDLALWFNLFLGMVARGHREWTANLKRMVKTAVGSVSRFDEKMGRELSLLDLDGVVCGHFHKPMIRGLGGFFYGNCGDWVESCSALAEDDGGAWHLLRWNGWDVVEETVQR